MSKTIKIINDELVEIASYINPEIVFHDSNNPRHLKSEYDNFESYCDFKEVINPFELYAENQQLKKSIKLFTDDLANMTNKALLLEKQKDDVVEYIKKNNFKYCDDELCYMIPNHFNNLLRMLGEIDD